jgi:hypothetical protein
VKLGTKADMARRWKVSPARVSALASRADFPSPIQMIGRSALYNLEACDRFRTTTRAPGRPRKADYNARLADELDRLCADMRREGSWDYCGFVAERVVRCLRTAGYDAEQAGTAHVFALVDGRIIVDLWEPDGSVVVKVWPVGQVPADQEPDAYSV